MFGSETPHFLAGTDFHTINESVCRANECKVIGKSGKTVGAIRTLLSTAAARQGRRAMLEVVE